MTFKQQHVYALLLLAVIVTIGGYLRLSHLAAYDLIQEELSHYYVADALAHDRPPALPSGQWYTRGIEYSRIVSFAERHIDTPEFAVRLPSAVLGTLCLILMAAGTWAMAGAWPAVGATLLLAIYPEAVTQSRLGRFYMFQLLFYLLAFFGGWLVLQRRSVTSAVRTWLGIIVVTLALLVAAHIQVTAFPSLFAWWLFLAGVGASDTLRGTSSLRRNVPLQFATAALSVLALMLLVDPALVDETIVRAVSTPYWARVRHAPVYFYVRQLLIDLSVVVVAAPFAFAYVLLRRRTLGLYLLAMFAVPALLFSFVLPFKAERFLLLGSPPLFIAVSIAATAFGAAIHRCVATYLARRLPEQRARLVAATAAIVVTVAALFVMRAPRTAWTSHWGRNEPKWDEAGAILRARPDLQGIPLGGTKSLPARFYWGRLEFNVGRNFLEQWSFSPLGEAGVSSGRVGAYVTLPIGSPDLYAGVPVLTTTESIRRRFNAARGVVIGIDGQARYFRMVDPNLLRILETEGEDLCGDRCGSLQLIFWRFR